jgi:hypothetical protein
MCIPMFSTFTCGRGADAVGAGSTTAMETDAAGAMAEVAAETVTERAGGAEAMAAEDAAGAGSGCCIGVDGARSQAALGRTSRAITRRAARGLIGAFLLQENVG